MSAPHLQHLAQLIGNDSHAATFQSLGQYRSALLKEIAQASAAPEQEAVGTVHSGKTASGMPWVEVDWHVQPEPSRGTKLYTHAAPPSAQDAAGLVDALEYCEKWFLKHSPTAPLIGGFGDAEHPMLLTIRNALAAHRAQQVEQS